jgi:hypothetical protein
MSMKYVYLPLALLIVSCSGSKEDSTKTVLNSPDSVGVSVDTTSKSKDSAWQPKLQARDSAMYIGAIGYYENSREFFIPIYHVADSIDETFYEDMQLELDSTIVQDEQITRKQLNIDVARKNFNLVGLEKISVFLYSGKKLGEATFVRVELADEMIESQYTAVFKPTTKFRVDDQMYCTSQGASSFKEYLWDWHRLADKPLDQQLLKTFELDSQDVWQIRHVRFDDLDATYSSISVHGDHESRITETKNGTTKTLKVVDRGYSLTELSPVHFSFNNHPVFISALAPNETDGYFEVLLAFDGERYKIFEGSRGSLK